MDISFWEAFKLTFVTILLAELGDKTQLLTLKLSLGGSTKLAVFLGAASALVLTSLLAVLFGDLLARVLPPDCIRHLFGAMFIVIGVLMFLGLF